MLWGPSPEPEEWAWRRAAAIAAAASGSSDRPATARSWHRAPAVRGRVQRKELLALEYRVLNLNGTCAQCCGCWCQMLVTPIGFLFE